MTEAGWTSNVPANEGEYWFRSDGVRKPIVAHVYLDVEQDLRIIIGINDVYVTDLDGFDEFDGAEFLGPLTPDSYQHGRVAGLREAANRLCYLSAQDACSGDVLNEFGWWLKEQVEPQQAQEEGVGDAER